MLVRSDVRKDDQGFEDIDEFWADDDDFDPKDDDDDDDERANWSEGLKLPVGPVARSDYRSLSDCMRSQLVGPRPVGERVHGLLDERAPRATPSCSDRGARLYQRL